MAYTLSQSYAFFCGDIVRMYFIQGMPYTFDELPPLIQDHPDIQAEALLGRDWDDEELYKISSYLNNNINFIKSYENLYFKIQ